MKWEQSPPGHWAERLRRPSHEFARTQRLVLAAWDGQGRQRRIIIRGGRWFFIKLALPSPSSPRSGCRLRSGDQTRSRSSSRVPARRSSLSAANAYHAVSLRWYLWGSHRLGAKRQLLNKQIKLAQLSGLLTLIWAG